MRHRGPDAQGVLRVTLPGASVTLGMSRLKIVDQSDITVPYDFRENLGVVLAFNGEIYNWMGLRGVLDHVPHGGWKTRCDAEVVAAAWRHRGPDCLDRFNGMFGLILVDVWEPCVFVARDRAGEKPLYRAVRGDIVYYASEIKALPVALTESTCPDADALEFDCAGPTMFADVEAVPPGCCSVHGHGENDLRTWWTLPDHEIESMEEKQAVDTLTDLLTDAVRIRHVAEVPVAVQLSGGLDSAIVQTVCQSERLYCVTFPEADNASKAKNAAQGRNAVPITFDRNDLVAALPSVAWHLDTPATWTAVCQWFMNKKIAADGAKIVLSGEGADELLGGYTRYRILHWLERALSDPVLSGYLPLFERSVGTPDEILGKMLDRGSTPESRAHARALVEEHGGSGGLIDRMAGTDFYTTMQVLLRMADRMASAFGLENRSPFFDYRVMEFAATIPARLKVTDHESKAVLRRVAERLGVHPAIVRERTKRGLYVPRSWGEGGSAWDRKWFVKLMETSWRERCCRPALCKGCEK